MTFPRLPHTAETKAKIAKAIKARGPRSPATKAKIAAALRGRKHTPETIAKLIEHRNRPRETPQAYTARRKAQAIRDRQDQWARDKLAAARSGDQALLADVLMSGGWRRKRRVFDVTGKVSDGYGQPRKVWRQGKWVLDG